MHVFYDGSIFALQSLGGINRYFAQLISHLPESYRIELTTTTVSELLFPHHRNLAIHRYSRFGFRPGRVSYWVEGRFFRRIFDQSTANIFHPTYYSLLSQQNPAALKGPVVATIFDLVHERYPESTDSDGVIRRAKRALVERADLILCLSQHTKDDIQEYFGIPAARIEVTHPGPSITRTEAYFPTTEENAYFLFVGNRWSYKNFPLFLKAFACVRAQNPRLQAIVVGPQLTRSETVLVYELGLRASVKDVGYLTDERLGALYRGALALVYPSAFEGFGFPLLEAMSCGTPVITTAKASIPEVVGDAALFVTLQHRDELISAMEEIVRDESTRESLRKQGYARAKLFSWIDCAEKTMALYKSVAP